MRNNRLKSPAVFIDRDGVLNKDRGFVHRPEDFEWIAGAPGAIKLCNDQGYLVIVVTNQSGIGRGYYPEEAFRQFTAWIDKELQQVGAHIDATYYCPHHPEAGLGEYRQKCRCRKPEPGLFLQALREWPIDAEKSFSIGDRRSDLEAAEAAGIKGYLFQGGNLLTFLRGIIAAR